MDEVVVPIIPLARNLSKSDGIATGFIILSETEDDDLLSLNRRPEVAERLVRDTSIESRGREIDWKDKSSSPQSFRGIECTLKALLSEEFDKSNSTEAQRRELICSTRGEELGSTESGSRLTSSFVDGGVRACGVVVVVGELVGGKVSKCDDVCWFVGELDVGKVSECDDVCWFVGDLDVGKVS